MITTVDRDDGTVASFVEAVRRVGFARHVAHLEAKSSTVLDFSGFQAAPPTVGGLA
jgi:hypothetical protein